MPINVAIDGPSSAGKSTIARRLAQKYSLTHIDTGAMYRCVALAVKRAGINPDDDERIMELLPTLAIAFDNNKHIYLDEENVTDLIRSEDISWIASTTSKQLAVREFLVAQQQEIAKSKGFVLDGRDIGTVVLPEAEVKIFLTADVEARAKRRYLEYQENGLKSDYNQIYEDIKKRDLQDSTRQNSPLKKAEDAIEIDTSELSIEEVLQRISEIIDSKLKGEEDL